MISSAATGQKGSLFEAPSLLCNQVGWLCAQVRGLRNGVKYRTMAYHWPCGTWQTCSPCSCGQQTRSLGSEHPPQMALQEKWRLWIQNLSMFIQMQHTSCKASPCPPRWCIKKHWEQRGRRTPYRQSYLWLALLPYGLHPAKLQQLFSLYPCTYI